MHIEEGGKILVKRQISERGDHTTRHPRRRHPSTTHAGKGGHSGTTGPGSRKPFHTTRKTNDAGGKESTSTMKPPIPNRPSSTTSMKPSSTTSMKPGTSKKPSPPTSAAPGSSSSRAPNSTKVPQISSSSKKPSSSPADKSTTTSRKPLSAERRAWLRFEERTALDHMLAGMLGWSKTLKEVGKPIDRKGAGEVFSTLDKQIKSKLTGENSPEKLIKDYSSSN